MVEGTLEVDGITDGIILLDGTTEGKNDALGACDEVGLEDGLILVDGIMDTVGDDVGFELGKSDG